MMKYFQLKSHKNSYYYNCYFPNVFTSLKEF